MMQEAGTAELTSNGTVKHNGVAAEGRLRDIRSKNATPFSDITVSNLMTLQQQQVNSDYYYMCEFHIADSVYHSQTGSHTCPLLSHVIDIPLSLRLSAH